MNTDCQGNVVSDEELEELENMPEHYGQEEFDDEQEE